MRTYPKALSIAGSDCSGGAGIQADLKTFSALGVYGMTAITALTAQNTTTVLDIMPSTPQHLALQLDAIFTDIVPDAVKIGMLFNSDIINVVAEKLIQYCAKNIVLDPVMISTSGKRLIAEEAIDAMVTELFPISTVITPNKYEAELIADMKIDGVEAVYEAASRILKRTNAVLIKGGHIDDKSMTDYLFTSTDSEPNTFASHFIDTKNTHGTGCTLSSAIAAHLALGYGLVDSIGKAKEYLTQALQNGYEITIGNGHGPVNHLWNPTPMKIK